MIRPPYDSLQAAIIACAEDNEELTLDILSGVIVALEAHREAAMKVYIVTENRPYMRAEVVGAFKSKEGAQVHKELIEGAVSELIGIDDDLPEDDLEIAFNEWHKKYPDLSFAKDSGYDFDIEIEEWELK